MEEEVERQNVLKSGQEWTLPAQPGQLKTEKVEMGCCKVICGSPMTFQGHWINRKIIRRLTVHPTDTTFTFF